MLRTCVACGLAAALTCGSSPAAGQEAPAGPPPEESLSQLGLEDLMKLEVRTVVTASKFVQDVRQAPASVTVITAEEIRLQGFRTLADVLRSVRGFYVSYDRNYSYIGVRGFARPGDYNTRVLLLVNGHRLHDTVYELALLGTEFPIDVALLDRVEIIRGPSSSLYGTSAFFAVVNVLTRPGSDFATGEVSVEGGSHDTTRLRGTLGGRSSGGVEGVISASRYRSAGLEKIRFPELDEPDRPAIARGLDGDRSASVFGSVRAGNFFLDGAYGSRTKDLPTGAYDITLEQRGSRTVDDQGYVSAFYSRRMRGGWSLEARGGLNRYAYAGYYLTEVEDGEEPVLYYDEAKALGLTGEATLARTLARHVLTFGADGRWNLQQDQLARGPDGVTLDDRRRSLAAGLYVQDEWRLSPKVLLNAGLRVDRYASFGGTLNPRLGLILMPRPGTTLKALAGRAFRAPSAYELYYYAGGPPLEPEKVWTGELAWDQRLGPHADLSASAYRYDVDGLITQMEGDVNPDGLYYANAESIRASGLEAELRLHWGSGVRVRGSYAVGRAEDDTGAAISNSPHHLARFSAVTPLRWGVVLGANAETVSARHSVRGPMVSGGTLANLTLSRAGLWRHVTVACSIYNAFDSRYLDPASGEHRQVALRQDGRTVFARLGWTF